MKIKKFLLAVMSTVLVITALICACTKINTDIMPVFDILAAEMTFPTGNEEYSAEPEISEPPKEESHIAVTVESSEISPPEESKPQIKEIKTEDFETSVPTEEEIQEYNKNHEGEEQYPVYEFTITQGNQSYQNIQIKNTSSTNIDIKSELESKLGFEMEQTDKPQVLIYHTHTSESFLKYDTGYFYESFYPRTTDTTRNICAVGEEIAKQLNAAGIKTIHDTTLHDYPSYNGAYDRSYATVTEYIKKYPTIKVTLDIHRDGIGTDTQKTKPVFTVNGKKAAQIMILSGYNYDGDEEFKNWEYNLRFALQIQKKANEMYPDMARPLNFSDFMYNMNINTGSLLIEMGAESNTLEEVKYSGYLLGKVLSQVLKKSDTSK